MFPTPAAVEGAKRMRAVAAARFDLDVASHEQSLIHTAGRYLDDLTKDNFNSPSDMMKEVEGLHKTIKRFQQDLSSSSPQLLAAIEWSVDGPNAAPTDSTMKQLDRKLAAINQCLSTYRKGSNQGTCVVNLCRALSNLYVLLMKKPFSKTTTPKAQRLSNVTEHFQAEGPQFVLSLAQAMDSSIRFAQVRTAIMKMPKDQGKNDDCLDVV